MSRMLDTPEEVGAPDPERENSPIVDESQYDEETGARDLEAERGVCFFNDRAYPIGTYVKSGSELLRCSRGGVWERLDEREGPA
jgi:hypothetical protein